MTVSNEGGWCGPSLSRNRAVGYTGGNVVDQPSHGEVRIRHLPTRSLVEYRPMPGYAGPDHFTVTLSPGNGLYLIDVTVKP